MAGRLRGRCLPSVAKEPESRGHTQVCGRSQQSTIAAIAAYVAAAETALMREPLAVRASVRPSVRPARSRPFTGNVLWLPRPSLTALGHSPPDPTTSTLIIRRLSVRRDLESIFSLGSCLTEGADLMYGMLFGAPTRSGARCEENGSADCTSNRGRPRQGRSRAT